MEAVKPVLKDVEVDILSADVNKVDIEPIKRAYRWMYAVWGKRFGKWFLSNFELGDKKDFWEEELEAILLTKSAKNVQLIYGLTKELLLASIRNGVQLANEGLSIDKIQAAIRNEITSAGGAISPGRARTIARTEVISASNTASFESAKSTGLQLEKKWITGGANIRDSHIAAEAEGWIGMNDIFSNGLGYPGDAGPPEEVINCKCTIIYRTI